MRRQLVAVPVCLDRLAGVSAPRRASQRRSETRIRSAGHQTVCRPEDAGKMIFLHRLRFNSVVKQSGILVASRIGTAIKTQ